MKDKDNNEENCIHKIARDIKGELIPARRWRENPKGNKEIWESRERCRLLSR